MHNACERFCNVDSLSTICIVDKEMRKAKQVIGAANSLCEGEKEKQMPQGTAVQPGADGDQDAARAVVVI